jgi:hypothetical protein
MKKLLTFVPVVAVACAFATLSAPSAFAASPGAGASGWHVGYINTSNKAISLAQAAPLTGGGATFNFTNQPNTALLINKGSGANLTGKTVTATFQLTGVTPPFIYGGESDGSAGSGPSTVRLYFETNNAGGFNETNYWWANASGGSTSLDTVGNNTTVTLTLNLIGSYWSDYYGHFGNDPTYSAGFAKAVKNVTGIGLSFGGGYFFENGVGTSNGLGSFQLQSFTTQ